ncbi:MAG TPA: type II secretion system F family protein [Thermoflexia bacterium]|jgi:tight adherence protein C|nr:type II secretion system F family protein [Thermoflexia bacterium]
MSVTALVILSVSVVGGLVLIVIGLLGSREEATVEERLTQLGTLERPPSLEEIELSQPFSERVLRPWLRKLAEYIARFTPEQTLARTRRNLELAGLIYRVRPAEFIAVRYLLMGVMGALAIAVASKSDASPLQKVGMIAVTAALGHFLPVLWLGSRINRRKREILKALPDALDLLTICVEAGLGFDAAMAKVVEKWDNELSEGFARVLQEIRLGKLRREALREMADTVDLPDFSTFVAAIIQAEQLGVSIAKVLRIQSDQMRVRRRQRAEEEARKAPVKIMLPAVLLIFPALFAIILGPAAINLMDILGGSNIMGP